MTDTKKPFAAIANRALREEALRTEVSADTTPPEAMVWLEEQLEKYWNGYSRTNLFSFARDMRGRDVALVKRETTAEERTMDGLPNVMTVGIVRRMYNQSPEIVFQPVDGEGAATDKAVMVKEDSLLHKVATRMLTAVWDNPLEVGTVGA